MYVISFKVEGKARPTCHQLCFFLFLYMFVNVERDPGPSANRWRALLVSGFKGQSQDGWDQTVSAPSTRRITHRYASERPPLCSLSVFKPTVWFVSSLGGLLEPQKSGGTHLAGPWVKGDGADTSSQSWNVPGSYNLGGFTLQGCTWWNRLFSERMFSSFFYYQRHIRWFFYRRTRSYLTQSASKQRSKIVCLGCWWLSKFFRQRLETCRRSRSLCRPRPRLSTGGICGACSALQLCILVLYVNEAQLASYCFHLRERERGKRVEIYSQRGKEKRVKEWCLERWWG